MKNPGILFLAIITFCFQKNTLAQQHKFEAGIEGGAGITSMWGNELVTRYNDPTLGFSGGIALQYNFPKIFSIRTIFSYDRKGSMSKGTFIDAQGNSLGNYTIYSHFNYLTLPILLRANFGKKIKYFFNAGPYLGRLSNQSSRLVAEQLPGVTYGGISNYTRYDIGLTAGAGIYIPIKKAFALSFELRDNLGLYNISKWPVYGNATLNTHSANLLLGIAYKFGARDEVAK